MKKNFLSAEEVMGDEWFLAWYFKQDATKSRMWEHWLLENPGQQAIVQDAIQLMKSIYLEESPVPQFQTETAFTALTGMLNAPVVTMAPRKRTWLIPAAAAVFVLALAGFLLLRSGEKEVMMKSGFGTISGYRLPDGSQVTLNANSTITMNEGWKRGKDREVWVKGEAFFKVEKTINKDRFIVHAGEMDIIVTGTQFNVVNTETESSVLLTEGSITVTTSDGRSIALQPGEFVRMESSTAQKTVADEGKLLAWKQSKLVFDKTPLSEVSKTIERHYGIRVVIKEKELEGKTISGIMPNNNLEVLIDALEATGEFKIVRNKDEIIITKP